MQDGSPSTISGRVALQLGLLVLLLPVPIAWADDWTTGSTSDALVTSGTATKVGIGVTAPSGILDIRPAAAASGVGLPLILQAQQGGPNSAGGNLLLNAGPNGTSGSNGSILFGTGGGIASNGTFTLGERMRIDGNGNVLIGTTTPNGGLLTVNGDVGISGRIRLGGDINFTQLNTNISGNTSDGSDNARLNLSAGGGINGDVNRGAYISLRGNENLLPGAIQIAAGNVPGGNISMFTGSGIQALSIDANQLVTGVTSKWMGNVSVIGNLNIGNQANVPNYSVNAFNKIASVGPSGGFYHFGSGDPSFLPNGNTQSILMAHAIGEGFISVRRTGTSPFVPFRIYTSETKRYEVDAAGNHTFFGPATINGPLNVSGRASVGVGGAASDVGFYLSTPSTGFSGTSNVGLISDVTFPTTATQSIQGIRAYVRTSPASYNVAEAQVINVRDPIKGAGSSISDAYGIKIENIRAGFNNNYSLYTGTGKVHFGGYMDVEGDARVSGTLIAQSVRTTSWDVNPPDYVFEKDYKLASLDHVEEYLAKNKHLPDIPSAKEILKEGIDLADMNMKLLKKVEELTMYAIAQDKRTKAQQDEIAELKISMGKLARMQNGKSK